MALKDTISRLHSSIAHAAQLKLVTEAVAPALFDLAQDASESVRSVVSESLGKLAAAEPAAILPKLAELSSSSSAELRGFMAGALRFALFRPTRTAPFTPILPSFLALLCDSDLAVRRQAFFALNVILNANLGFVQGILSSSILPVLLPETQVRKELIREVDLGPFQRIIDEGFPLRKTVYQCIETLVDVAAPFLDVGLVTKSLHNGFTDDEADIQILTYQIIYKLAKVRGASLLDSVEELPPLLLKGITTKLKQSKEADPQRALDVLRSSVRALKAVKSIPGSEFCEAFTAFYLRVLQTSLLKDMLASMSHEN